MSEDTAVDSTIDLKKRARRRLVGAVALALLAIIVLPIVMDSEPKPSGQEIQIRIPSQDNDSVVARVLPSRPAPPVSQSQETKPAPLVLPAGKDTEPAEKAALSATAVVPIEPVKPKVGPASAKAESAKKPEVVHAETAMAGKDSEQWVVQLGAYQKAANVKQLTVKLKDMGLPSYTEKFDSPQGSRTRMRAGPFNSREAADKARLRIKKIGIDGLVVQK